MFLCWMFRLLLQGLKICSRLIAIDDVPKPGALFRGIFHVLLDVAQLFSNLAAVLLNIAFCFQRLVTHELTGGFLDRSFRLFDAALNLVFVDAHDVLLLTQAGKRPARDKILWMSFDRWIRMPGATGLPSPAVRGR